MQVTVIKFWMGLALIFFFRAPVLHGQSENRFPLRSPILTLEEAACTSGVLVSSLIMPFQESINGIRVEADTTCPLGSEIKFKSDVGNTLFSYSDGDHFLYMSPFGLYSHLLLSMWEGGSHVGVRVFFVDAQSIRKVFDKQIKAPPEFIKGWGDLLVLVISRPKRGDPETKITLSDLYVWSKEGFTLARTVPLEKRFAAAAALVSEHQ